MTDRELCEQQWNSTEIGSPVNRVGWKKEDYYTHAGADRDTLKRTWRLVARAVTHRGKRR